MSMQLTMPLTEDLLNERKQVLKLKRQRLDIINQDRERLIYEIEALRVEVGEPDQAQIDNDKWLAEMKADEEC